MVGGLLAALGLLAGCSASEVPAPAPDIVVVGGPGSADGRFATPRATAWDPRGCFYVVDKMGRIQRFDGAGRFLNGWSVPAIAKGRPTGLAVDPNGNLVVADTHYHRILRYTPEGKLLSDFGSEGTGPGRFIYPVGLAIAPDGTIYVSEFGGNDRIQVFSRDGAFLRGWGLYGEGPGEFKRPQGLALSGDRLFVADAANHRIQVFTLDGKHIASWGGVVYPYSVSVDSGGAVLVAEYGRHRVSRFTADGQPRGTAGHAGREPGDLDTPWAAVAAGDRVLVVDAGNHRVQLWPSSLLKN